MTQSRFAAVVLLVLAPFIGCSGDGDHATGGGGAGGAGGEGGGTSSTGSGAEARPLYFLRIDDSPPPPVVLDLDKQKALEVFGEATAKQIKLLDVDSTPLLDNVLTRIQSACGIAWQNDTADPMHDCSLTPLGQSFGPNWQTTSQFAMVRLLSMTPANANVTGSSLDNFFEYVSQVNPQLFRDVLAEMLFAVDQNDLATPAMRTRPVIPKDKLILALQTQLLGTHPAIANSSGMMPVTMYDALLDMTPLADKLGPSGPHPGVLVPDDATFTTKSDALLTDFRMRVVADSNLRRVSGIDLGRGAGDMFLQENGSALDLDFMNPQKLEITGIAQNPTIDMRIQISEHPDKVPSCTDSLVQPNPACKGNYPSTPVGTDTVWTIPPFSLESIVAHAGHSSYQNRVYSNCIITINSVCVVGIDIGANGNPPGWIHLYEDLGSVEDAPDQFLWEMLLEVSQVALHDPTGDGTPDIPEGQAKPVYALHGVPIGLTGPELLAQMRPTLQSQAAEISDAILGRYWVHNSALDFYYRRAQPDGTPTLFFVAESDVRPDPSGSAPKPYTYAKPGFYSNPDLSDGSKVSEKVLPGIDDQEHEKYRLPTGETTLYMQDDDGSSYEVRFHVPDGADPTEIVAEVIER